MPSDLLANTTHFLVFYCSNERVSYQAFSAILRGKRGTLGANDCLALVKWGLLPAGLIKNSRQNAGST